MRKSSHSSQSGGEVIHEPKEFEPSEFGLPEDVRYRPDLIDLSTFPSQCGMANESQDVEAYNGTLGVSVGFVDQHQRPVGQTMRGDGRSCSGTLIGRDLFLTAGHCFDPSSNPQTQVTFNFQNDPSGNPRQEQRFPIDTVLEHRLGGLDYAIIQLRGNPGNTFGRALISGTDAAIGDIVAIIGHPATVAKQIEGGAVLNLTGNGIRYNDVDTLPGNSGSGILHSATGRIVGVHTNGGCGGTNPETGFNLGVRVSSLLRESPILREAGFVGRLVGELLFYRDTTQNGTGQVFNPSVIGRGGWQNFKFVFSGGNGIIYAVDQDGQLLFYRDTTQNGTGEIFNPSVIGLGGWQDFKFVFSGGNGIIYAVDQDGQLLFYRDTTQNGTGQVFNPSVIGLGGWQDFKFVFSGGNGIIYAVDQDGRLLFYRDTTQNGTGQVFNPSVIGLGGWQDFKFVFSGGNGIIYAVDQAGQLLFYRDTTQNGTGQVFNPSVIGLGGWQDFKFVFSGGNGIIYAVVA